MEIGPNFRSTEIEDPSGLEVHLVPTSDLSPDAQATAVGYPWPDPVEVRALE